MDIVRVAMAPRAMSSKGRDVSTAPPVCQPVHRTPGMSTWIDQTALRRKKLNRDTTLVQGAGDVTAEDAPFSEVCSNFH